MLMTVIAVGCLLSVATPPAAASGQAEVRAHALEDYAARAEGSPFGVIAAQKATVEGGCRLLLHTSCADVLMFGGASHDVDAARLKWLLGVVTEMEVECRRLGFESCDDVEEALLNFRADQVELKRLERERACASRGHADCAAERSANDKAALEERARRAEQERQEVERLAVEQEKREESCRSHGHADCAAEDQAKQAAAAEAEEQECREKGFKNGCVEEQEYYSRWRFRLGLACFILVACCVEHCKHGEEVVISGHGLTIKKR